MLQVLKGKLTEKTKIIPSDENLIVVNGIKVSKDNREIVYPIFAKNINAEMLLRYEKNEDIDIICELSFLENRIAYEILRIDNNKLISLAIENILKDFLK